MSGPEITPAPLDPRLQSEQGQAGKKTLGGIGRIIRFGYRSNDDNATRSGLDHLLDGALVDTPDSEPRPEDSHRADSFGGVAHQLDAHRRTARLGRRGPDRTDTEVVKPVDYGRGIDLLPRVSGETDPRRGADDPSSCRERQVFLTDVQDRSRRKQGDVGPIVGGPESTMALRDRSKNLEKFQLLSSFDGLVSQLDDVYTARERRVEKFREITTFFSGIGAEVEPGSHLVHSANSKGHFRTRESSALAHLARPDHG